MLEKEEPQEEYIVTSSDVYNAHNLYSENGYADSIGEFYKSLERIVRCRDCKHYSNEPWEHYNGSVTTSNCWYFSDYEGTPAQLEPDGFCAWGEPREVMS